MSWTIRILNWREFQHYKDRDPPWIKLHQRKLQMKPAWRKLSGNEGKLLVDLWMLAAGTKDGRLSDTLEDLCYKVRRQPTGVLANLRALEAAAFIELNKQTLALASTPQALDAPETEGETEGEGELKTRLKSAADAAVRRLSA